MKRKWRPVDVWGLAIVGAVFLAATVTLLILSAKFFAAEGVTYTVDIASTRDKVSWTTSLDPELKSYLLVDYTDGVACELPPDLNFRGVIMRGREIHGRVRDYRVFRDEYYIEFRNGEVRCVEDSRPWSVVAAQLDLYVPGPLRQYLVEQGVIDSCLNALRNAWHACVMVTRRRISPTLGREAVGAWVSGDRAPDVVATAVRYSLEELAARAPGGSVEVRIPPYGATQCVGGMHHTRGTPPNVVEADPDTWLRLVTGLVAWQEATTAGLVAASGMRADLAAWLPLIEPGDGPPLEPSPDA